MSFFCPQSSTVVGLSDSELRRAVSVLRDVPLQVGLEREAWRITPEGCPAATRHPFAPGEDLFPEGRITVDFAENQAEFVTGPMAGARAAAEGLRALHARLHVVRPDELLWPLSIPGCWGPEVQPARFADLAEFEGAREYRRYLKQKYGAARQSLCGVHFNVSLPEAFWRALSDQSGSEPDRSAWYFAMIRNLLRFRFLLTYLFGASPLVDAGWGAELVADSDPGDRLLLDRCGHRLSSLRSSPLGYRVDRGMTESFAGAWSGLDAYVEAVERAVGAGLLASEREFYSPVRPKAPGGGLAALARDGVGYIELRMLDLDPFSPVGISRETLLFLEALVVATVLLPSPVLGREEVADEAGLNGRATLCSLGGGELFRQELVRRTGPLCAAMVDAARVLGPDHEEAVDAVLSVVDGRAPRLVDRFFDAASGGSLFSQGMRQARAHRKEFLYD